MLHIYCSILYYYQLGKRTARQEPGDDSQGAPAYEASPLEVLQYVQYIRVCQFRKFQYLHAILYCPWKFKVKVQETCFVFLKN